MMGLVWNVILVVVALVFICFIFVIAFGAPYLPTLKPQVTKALDLIDLKKGQTLLELGSGDGRILIEAAQRGINGIGYELNPLLVIYSKVLTVRYRKQIKIVWANFWHQPLPQADGIFVFLLDRFMQKLDAKIIGESKKPVKLVSFAFKVPGRKISKQSKGLLLYLYK